MNHPDETDLATVADRPVAEATAIPPDNLPDDPRAYLAWLRNPARPARRPKPQRLRLVPEPVTYTPHETRDPAYTAASEKLRRLPDLGIASLEAARAQLGADARYEDLVLHAAANPVTPPTAATHGGATSPAPYADAPACTECGTALDPDGTCLTCTTNGPTR